MYGDENLQMQHHQRSVDLKNMYADFSQSKDCFSNEDSMAKGHVQNRGFMNNIN